MQLTKMTLQTLTMMKRMTLTVLLLVMSSFLEVEGGGAVMGLLAFTSEEKIGKNLNSSKMATNGTGGPIYNRTDYRKLLVFHKI